MKNVHFRNKIRPVPEMKRKNTASGKHLRILSWDQINLRYGHKQITQLTIAGDKEFFRKDHYITDIHSWGICLCESGNCRIIIDGKRYQIKSGDMFIVFRNKQLVLSGKSPDFKGYVIAADIKFLGDIEAATLPRLMMLIRKHPCARLSQVQRKIITAIYDMLPMARSETHRYTDNMLISLFKTLYYEIAGIYSDSRTQQENMTLNRKEYLCRDFSSLILHYCGQVRDVSFYAEKLNISPRYLCECVREVSGYTPSGWITIAVINKAKTLLNDGRYSIQQISDILGFPNPSFFSQYFKKNTGITPKQYRESERLLLERREN